MSANLNITLAQTPCYHEVAENLQTARRCFPEAAAQQADLLVFPEMFMARPRQGEPLAGIAQPLDGDFVAGMADLCRRYRTAALFGMWEKVADEDQRAANVVIVLDASGELICRYHKIHLFDALSVRESELMTGGHEPPPLFTLQGITLGLAICYDLRFPELFRYLAGKGAQAVLVPAAWYEGTLKEDHWLTLLRARAIENTLYVGGANLCGSPFAARTACFDPFGVMLGDAGEGENLISMRVEESRLQAVRSKLPTLSHCRIDLFRS